MSDNVRTALVVDDSRLARIALSKLLQRRNISVDVVGTGTEAVDYLEDQRPDVVFMDYMMPDMDGFEATRRIRTLSDGERMPVVMYTSQDTDEDRDRARELGIVGFLSKPSGEHSLDDVLGRLGRLIASGSHGDRRPPETDPEPLPETEAAPDVEPAPATENESTRMPPGEPPPWQHEPEPAGAVPARHDDGHAAFRSEPEPEPEPESEPADDTDVAETPSPRDTVNATSTEAPPPADTAGTTPSAPTVDLPWAAIRDVARQAADEAVMDATERAVTAAAGPLREELEGLARGARREVEERARGAAREAAEAASAELADATARRIGERVAEETTRRVIEEVGPEAARVAVNDLRREVRDYVSEMFAADAFRDQIVELITDKGLPPLRDALSEELLPQVREQILSDTLRKAERKAVEAAREEGRLAAQQALERHLSDLAEEQARRTRALVQEARNRMLIGLSAVGAVAFLALVLALFLR